MKKSLQSREDRIFQGTNAFFLLLFSLFFLVPFLMLVTSSFIGPDETARRAGTVVLWPESIDPGAYRQLLQSESPVYQAYFMTLVRTIFGTLLQIILTAAMAYALTRPNLPGRKFFVTMLIGAMVFPVAIIPLFLTVKGLGMLDTVWALLLPHAINTQYVFIMRAFFKQIPDSLEDAARIDGCNDFQLFLKVALPLSLPSLATISMFYAVWQWNEWFDATMFIITADHLLPVQNYLNDIIHTAGTSDLAEGSANAAAPGALKAAAIIIATGPIVCVYPFIQKYFVKGFMVGGVKG